MAYYHPSPEENIMIQGPWPSYNPKPDATHVQAALGQAGLQHDSHKGPSYIIRDSQTQATKSDLDTWNLSINSRVIPITPNRKNLKRRARGSLAGGVRYYTSDLLHDLLAASLVPLTEHSGDPKEIQDQAEEFLSSFSGNIATWEVDVKSLPNRERQVIYGLTENARDPSVGYRFLRFLFPFVRFEWHVETPYYVLGKFDGTKPIQIKFLWKAWTRDSTAAGLVAYGFSKDTIVTTEEGYPVIQKRQFEVANVIQPELMTPVPYLERTPPLSTQDDFMIFSTSQTFLQTLRSSQKRMAFLVALSALVTSLKPIVDRFSLAAGWVLAGLGIAAALISVLSVVVGWMLTWIEANAAKHRQIGSSA